AIAGWGRGRTSFDRHKNVIWIDSARSRGDENSVQCVRLRAGQSWGRAASNYERRTRAAERRATAASVSGIVARGATGIERGDEGALRDVCEVRVAVRSSADVSQ